MKEIVIYKVKFKEYDSLFYGKTIEIITDDVNKIFYEFRMKYNLKVKPYKTISVLL